MWDWDRFAFRTAGLRSTQVVRFLEQICETGIAGKSFAQASRSQESDDLILVLLTGPPATPLITREKRKLARFLTLGHEGPMFQP
jgi:hypothetical protein